MHISDSGAIEVTVNERLTVQISTVTSVCVAELSDPIGTVWTVPPRRTDHLLMAQLCPQQDTRFTALFGPAGSAHVVRIKGNPREETLVARFGARCSKTYEVVVRA